MNYTLGLAQLLFVVVMWTAVNEVTQDVFFSGYQKPFLVTYLNTGSFVLYLIPYLPSLLWRRQTKPADDRVRQAPSEADPLLPPTSDPPQVPSSPPKPPLTVRETALLGAKLWAFYFTANCFQNASFAFTTVASSTILTSMSGFFSLFIAPLFGLGHFKWSKLASVAVSFAGVALVSLSDAHSDSPAPAPFLPTFASTLAAPWLQRSATSTTTLLSALPSSALLGDALALTAALFWASYVVLLDAQIGDAARADMTLFFGFLGLTDVLAGAVLGGLLHLLGWETLEVPPDGRTWAVLGITSAVILVTDFVYAHAALNTTPLVVTLGMTLPIPLAAVWDTLAGRPTTLQVMCGAALVTGGFVVVGMQDAKESEESRGERAEEVGVA